MKYIDRQYWTNCYIPISVIFIALLSVPSSVIFYLIYISFQFLEFEPLVAMFSFLLLASAIMASYFIVFAFTCDILFFMKESLKVKNHDLCDNCGYPRKSIWTTKKCPECGENSR